MLKITFVDYSMSNIRKAGLVTAVFCLSIGFIGFVGTALISADIINYKREVPLSDIQGIVEDKSGNTYIGIGFFDKIQVYDRDGKFIRNWSVPAGGASFNVGTKDQNILVSIQKSSKQIEFASDGKIISDTYNENAYTPSSIDWNKYKNPLINQNIFFKIFYYPVITFWLMTGIGVAGIFLLAPGLWLLITRKKG